MARVQYSKTELKRQRDLLQTFTRFLPILNLKKKQLQSELRIVDNQQKMEEKKLEDSFALFEKWAEYLDSYPDIIKLFKTKMNIIDQNIAGVRMPKIKSFVFEENNYDLFETPPWVDLALSELKCMKRLTEEIRVYKKQKEILSGELMIVTRRINLFEKVRIPQTEEIIRVIKIYLDEEQTASVIRGKKCKEILKRKSA